MSFVRDLTLKQIRAYTYVVRTGSVTKAAEALFVTPPAISSQLKTLQHLVGTDIIRRESSGLRPTQAGLELVELYEQLSAAMESTAHKIEAVKAGKSGAVGVAVVSTGKYFAPSIFAAFVHAFPDIKLMPLIGNRREVIKALENRSVDMAIMGRPPANLDVTSHVLGDHPNIMIAPPDHPLVLRGAIEVSALLAETLLIREQGSGTRMLARQFMDSLGEGMRYEVMEIGSNETIKQSVMAGLGIAMISKHTVLSELEQGRLVALDIPGLPIMRKWILVQPKDRKITGAATCFHDFLFKNRKRFIPDHNVGRHDFR